MKVFLARRAQKELDRIPGAIARNIAKRLLALGENPHPLGSKKLAGKENYRLKVGSFRAIYTVDKKKKEITVLRVADRKTIYR